MPEYILYHYDKEGKITATGTIDTDIYKIIPPMSTIVCPPKIGKFEELRFNAEEEKWEVIPNYTDITFIDKNGKLHTIIEPGVSPEEGWQIYEPEDEQIEDFTNNLEQRISDLEKAIADILGGAVDA